jgi:hypothetical protein
LSKITIAKGTLIVIILVAILVSGVLSAEVSLITANSQNPSDTPNPSGSKATQARQGPPGQRVQRGYRDLRAIPAQMEQLELRVLKDLKEILAPLEGKGQREPLEPQDRQELRAKQAQLDQLETVALHGGTEQESQLQTWEPTETSTLTSPTVTYTTRMRVHGQRLLTYRETQERQV